MIAFPLHLLSKAKCATGNLERDADDSKWFPGVGQSAAASRAICRTCPVISECAAYAIENNLEGVWGGTTDRERSALRSAPKRRAPEEYTHGTQHGYQRHKLFGEEPCAECVAGNKAANKATHARKMARRALAKTETARASTGSGRVSGRRAG